MKESVGFYAFVTWMVGSFASIVLSAVVFLVSLLSYGGSWLLLSIISLGLCYAYAWYWDECVAIKKE